MVQESFSFGYGSKLFNLCKAMDPVIENIWRTKIFKSNIFMIHKVLPKFTKYCLTNIWSHTVVHACKTHYTHKSLACNIHTASTKICLVTQIYMCTIKHKHVNADTHDCKIQCNASTYTCMLLS